MRVESRFGTYNDEERDRVAELPVRWAVLTVRLRKLRIEIRAERKDSGDWLTSMAECMEEKDFEKRGSPSGESAALRAPI